MKKVLFSLGLLFLLFLMTVSFQMKADVYTMDHTDFFNVVNKTGFNYTSKKFNSSMYSHTYYNPTIPFEAFPSLKIKGASNASLERYEGDIKYAILELESNTSGQFIVSTNEGLITRIEITYSNGGDTYNKYYTHPLIDGTIGIISPNTTLPIMSQDGKWKTVTISSNDKTKRVTIWKISVVIGEINKNDISYVFDSYNKCFNVKSCNSTVLYADILSNLDYDNNNYPVVGIADNAFDQCSNLKTVKIPDCIKTIGKNAFKNCSSLSEIRLPQSIESIGSDAFFGCASLSKVYGNKISDFCQIKFSNKYSNPLNNGANLYIDDELIKSITFDSNIKAIGNYSFAGCTSIEDIDLNENINTIGVSAFTGCTNLSCVTSRAISPFSINANVFDNQTYKGTLLVPKESIGQYKNKVGWANFHKIAAIEGPNCDFVVNGIYYNIVDLSNLTCKVTYDNPYYNSYFQEEISIPETVEYNGRAFSVIGIDNNAFNGSSNLTNISLPQTIQLIGEMAFDGCTALKHLEIPNTISTMEASFSELPIQKVVLFGDGETIPNWFKSNKSLSTIELNCTNITTVSDNAFEDCQSLTKILLPNTIATIGNSTFKGCIQLSSITIPVNLSEIPENAFYGCTNLKEISFGNNLTSIGKSAFSNCTSLEQLFIPNSVNNISDNAFLGCSKISNIIIEDSEKLIKLENNVEGANTTGLFSSCPLIELHIGRDIDGTTPFIKNKALETLVIGSQVKTFPDLSLGYLPKLKTLKLGKSLTNIPSFNTCTNLEYLEIGARLSNIPSFSNCSSLRTIRLHSAKPQIVEDDFSNKVYTDCSLEVPKGTIETYRSAPIWKNFFSHSEFEPEALATQIEFVPSFVSLYPNETTQLNPVVSPLNANEVFEWESTNSDVVNVDAHGEITAVKEGDAIITAKTLDGSNISAQCKVVVKPIIFITELVPEADYIPLTVGTNSNLNVTILPNDATYKNLLWSSSDDSIVTVSNNGVVNAIDIGKCTIKIDASDGSGASAYILIDVLPRYINNIEIQSDITSLVEGEQCQLNVSIEPENASIKEIKWEVSDSSVMAISETGIVTGLKPGKAIAYAYTTDGSNLFATQEFEILPKVSSTITAQLGQDGLIDLHWSAKDYVKNVKDFNVYVSEDGGDFVLWLHNTTKTSTKYKGVDGRHYRFTVTMRNSNLITENYDEAKNAYIYVTK